MRVLSRICSILSWVLFLFSLLVQGLLILTFSLGGRLIGQAAADNEVNRRALPFVAVGTLLFAAGFLLFCFVRKRHWLWYAVMVIGAALLAGAGLYLKNQYPETIVSEGRIAGYDSAFKLVWRHFLPLAVALLQLLVGVFRGRAEDRRLREEALREVEEKGCPHRFE